MNKLIALTTLIVLLNVVSSGKPPVCGLIGGDTEKIGMFWDCMKDNFPADAINTVIRCHQTSFASAEATRNYLGAICDENTNDDEIRAMKNCLDEGRSEIGLENDVIISASQNTDTCYMQKTGLTQEEYFTIINEYVEKQ